jgi:hypothetical protein
LSDGLNRMTQKVSSFSSLTEAALLSAGFSGEPIWVLALWRPFFVVGAFLALLVRFIEHFSSAPPTPWLPSPLIFTLVYCLMLARAVPNDATEPGSPSAVRRARVSGWLSLNLAAVERWQYTLNLHHLLVSGWVCVALVMEVRALGMSAWGAAYDPSPRAYRLGWLIWIVYFNRYLQGLDTLFLLLRDKYVSVLHVFQQLALTWSWWLVLRINPGGDSWFAAFLQALYNATTYGYFVYKRNKRPTLRAQRRITHMLMALLALSAVHTLWVLWTGKTPCALALVDLAVMSSMLLLFGNFRYHKYLKPFERVLAERRASAELAAGGAQCTQAPPLAQHGHSFGGGAPSDQAGLGPKLVLSFDSSGWLYLYHFGVCRFMQARARPRESAAAIARAARLQLSAWPCASTRRACALHACLEGQGAGGGCSRTHAHARAHAYARIPHAYAHTPGVPSRLLRPPSDQPPTTTRPRRSSSRSSTSCATCPQIDSPSRARRAARSQRPRSRATCRLAIWWTRSCRYAGRGAASRRSRCALRSTTPSTSSSPTTAVRAATLRAPTRAARREAPLPRSRFSAPAQARVHPLHPPADALSRCLTQRSARPTPRSPFPRLSPPRRADRKDAWKQCSGRLRLLVTRVAAHPPWFLGDVISRFESQRELRAYLRASCHMPVFGGVLPYCVDGRYFFDGLFWASFLVPWRRPTARDHVLKVSAIGAPTAHLKPPQLPPWWTVMPPSTAVLRALYERGYQDALDAFADVRDGGGGWAAKVALSPAVRDAISSVKRPSAAERAAVDEVISHGIAVAWRQVLCAIASLGLAVAFARFAAH